MEYQIAFGTEAGAWDIVKTFEAANDDEATKYTKEYVAKNHPDRRLVIIKIES